MTLFDDSEVKVRVRELWSEVFKASNQLIVQAGNYGFSQIGVIPDPTIHQMLVALRAVESVLDVIIDNQIFDDLDYDETRLLINAREQLRRMQSVAIALKADDRVGYEKAIKDIELQAPF